MSALRNVSAARSSSAAKIGKKGASAVGSLAATAAALQGVAPALPASAAAALSGVSGAKAKSERRPTVAEIVQMGEVPRIEGLLKGEAFKVAYRQVTTPLTTELVRVKVGTGFPGVAPLLDTEGKEAVAITVYRDKSGAPGRSADQYVQFYAVDNGYEARIVGQGSETTANLDGYTEVFTVDNALDAAQALVKSKGLWCDHTGSAYGKNAVPVRGKRVQAAAAETAEV
jgi:hypothetical protein